MVARLFSLAKGFLTISCVAALLAALTFAQGCSKFSAKADKDKAEREKQTYYAQLIGQAEQAAKANQTDLALDLLDQAVRAGYSKAAAESQKGKTLLAAGAYAKAAKSFEEVLRIDPDNREAAVMGGYASYMAGDLSATEATLSGLVSKDPKQYYAKYLLGVTYNKVGKPDLAVKEFQAVVSQAGENQNLLNNLGISYFMLGQYENAKNSFVKALSFGQSKRTQNNLALTWCRLKRYDEAFKAFKMSGGEAFAYNNVGCCYIDVGDRQKAMELFNKAISVSPAIYKPAHDNIARYGVSSQDAASVKTEYLPTSDVSHAPRFEMGAKDEAKQAPARVPMNMDAPAPASAPKIPAPLVSQ
jgi:tetratricopeptide (TPR) repeat protein